MLSSLGRLLGALMALRHSRVSTVLVGLALVTLALLGQLAALGVLLP